MLNKQEIESIIRQLKAKPASEVLDYFIQNYPDEVVFSTSLSAEDQVLTDMIYKLGKEIKMFMLDTGRLFQETYDLLEKTNTHYNISIKLYFPDQSRVEQMVNEKGINLFYRSIENRKLCCNIRKYEPLNRALKNNQIWITGIRREQAITRYGTPLVEWDNVHQIIKVNPLYEWTEKQVWEYIRKHNVPYNVLHDIGYPSIGCQPCTKAVKPGEDFRSGRWWWEAPENKECGIHNHSR